MLRFSVMASLFLILVSTCANAQNVPSWVGNLVLQNSTITADPTLTTPEAQGLGLKFELLYAMTNTQDPQNTDNDVISVFTTLAYPAGIGVAVRDMLPKAKIATLTNQINIKYYFPTRSLAAARRGSSSTLTPVMAHHPITLSATLVMAVSARAVSPEFGIMST